MVEAFPLSWPSWIARTPRHEVKASQFSVSPGQATRELYDELRRLGATDIVVSSNVAVRKDGRPYARPPRIEDAGVAVYFTRKGVEQVIACDRYREPWENVRAIGNTINRLRGIERDGTSQMVDAAFRGFAALPEQSGDPGWWTVLGVDHDATVDEIRTAYREMSWIHHPDYGGDPATFRDITEAYEQGMAQARR